MNFIKILLITIVLLHLSIQFSVKADQKCDIYDYINQKLNKDHIFDVKWIPSMTKKITKELVTASLLKRIFSVQAAVALTAYKVGDVAYKTVRVADPERIFGNILWCGSGDVAESPDQLGKLQQTDSCCRDHDKCFRNIEAKASVTKVRPECKSFLDKYGKKAYRWCTNYEEGTVRLATMSDCSCDEKLRNCLQGVMAKNPNSDESTAASFYGNTFFNVLQMKCLYDDPNLNKVVARRQGWWENNPTKPRNGDRFGNSTTQSPPCNPCVGPNPPVGNCTIVLRGEYREIEAQAAKVEKGYNNENIDRVTVSKERLLGMRVCAHAMRTHCHIPPGACGVWGKTHEGEPLLPIVFSN